MLTLNLTKHFTLEMSLSSVFLQVGSKEYWVSCVDHNTGKLIKPSVVSGQPQGNSKATAAVCDCN